MGTEPSASIGDRALSDRAVIDALQRAVIVTTPGGEILLWNRAAADLFGWTEDSVLGQSILDVVVPRQGRADADGILAAVSSGERWTGDFTVERRDGSAFRVLVTNSPVLDDDENVVAIVGVSEDVTDQRRLEQRAEELAANLALALDAGGLGTWRWNMHTGETTWDATLEELFGLGPGEFDGTFQSYVALLHPDDVDTVLGKVQRAVETKSAYVVDHRVVWPDGSVHWLQGKGRVLLDASGNVTGTIGCVTDVSDQVSAIAQREAFTAEALRAAENERVSRERLEFLGEINDALASSSSREEVMRNVTRVSVPRLGDWCAIFVLGPDSPVPLVEIAHVDPDMIAYATELQNRFPYDPSAQTGIPAVIRSGRSEFYPEIDEELIDQADATDEERDVVRALALRSAIAVPLKKDGRILGAMQFVNVESSRRYTADDLALASAVAARIASSLEYIRLNEHQRMIATTLQASLLPETLPDIPGLDVAVRYWATGEGTEVGGDFFDLFEVEHGWAVVIGDVCGTGPTAASLTGLARHTIRASAWYGADPDAVLRHLNNAVLRSGRCTFCTVVFGTIARSASGFTLEIACGGHPLPILRRATGGTAFVGEPGSLLGVLDDARSVTASIELRPGDTVVLYTDGVTDVRPPHDLDDDALRAIVEQASDRAASASEVADRLGHEISSILPLAQRKDDIALLVLRVADLG